MKGKKRSLLNELQIKAQLGGVCERCKLNITPLSVEHIIPASLCLQLRAEDFVYDKQENMVLWCKPCNAYKGGKIDILDHRTIPLLKEIINRL